MKGGLIEVNYQSFTFMYNIEHLNTINTGSIYFQTYDDVMCCSKLSYVSIATPV